MDSSKIYVSNLENLKNQISTVKIECIPNFNGTFRQTLKEEKNIIANVEVDGISYSRKYVPNIIDNKIKLYYSNIKSIKKDRPRTIASLCIVHGFGHHSGEFLEFATVMAKNGIECHMIDLRGHGFSTGSRFDWLIEEFHTDIITLIKLAENDISNAPLFIFGHSMGGGLISSLFIKNQYLQVNGIILSAPLIGNPLTVESDAFKSFILGRVGNDLRDFVLHGNINPASLTKDESEIIRILNDPKIMPLATPRSFRSILKNCERILENCRYLNLPCLILHGSQDKVTNINDSKVFIENMKHKTKELYVINNGYHEMYIDNERNEFFAKIYQWILDTKHIGKTDRPFPIDIHTGVPDAIYGKIRLSFIIRLIMIIFYFYIGQKLKVILKSKISRLLWPVFLPIKLWQFIQY